MGGVARVYEGLYRYLPEFGVEFVTEEPDVFHAHIALYEPVSPDLPLVVSSHGLLWDEHQWERTGWRINKLCIEAYRQADVVTTPSDFIAQAIQRNMLIDPLVVRHGIDSAAWLPGENHGYVLWNKARVDPANDPEAVMWLAGRFPALSFVSTFGRAGKNIQLTGQVEPHKMKELVRGAAVYLDTPKESGGPCFGVLEALSCEVPVLSWREGGSVEAVIHGETGYLAEPGNMEDMAAGLAYCLEHRDRLGKAGRQHVLERYQWPQVVGGYYEAYQQAIKAHQHAKKVSVVVPCYNLGRFLPGCIESVQRQTLPDWEVIIVNDASTDNSAAIANQLADDDSRVKVIHHLTNQHVAQARNHGIQQAQGAYILPLDADDRLPPDALEKLVGVLDTDRTVDIAAGKLILFNEDNLIQGRVGEWPNNADYELQIQGYNRLPYSSLYRRRVWERVGGYRQRIRDGVEDADFWTRALSFGCRATIIDQPTLWYTMRSDGLGKKNSRGTDAWLPWFGWAGDPKLTPFGAAGKGVYPVRAFDQPKVSIVIPVGPGHGKYLQGCIDSLLAQTDQRWEAVVINDTGHPLPLDGMPFIRLVESHQFNVAAARNKGIQAARADKIIFLDVDDIAQARMVELFLIAHTRTGGWLYADWLAEDGIHTAPDWDLRQFRVKMLAPITGLYEKQHLLDVGLFDEKAPGWEDWEMQNRLVLAGVCGTRVAYPAIYYNMGAGQRREENFSRAEELVQYIQRRYGDKKMACSKCGGHASLKVKTAAEPVVEGQVLMAYTGSHASTFTRRSPTVKGTFYRINNRKPFWVAASDVDAFLRNPKEYKVIEQAAPAPLTAEPTAALTAPVLPEKSLDELAVRPDTLVFLKRQFSTIPQVERATDADLLSIKGIGEARVREIRQALGA
jgi:glycosyltransferase involved in cell wall biosynthesis